MEVLAACLISNWYPCITYSKAEMLKLCSFVFICVLNLLALLLIQFLCIKQAMQFLVFGPVGVLLNLVLMCVICRDVECSSLAVVSLGGIEIMGMFQYAHFKISFV